MTIIPNTYFSYRERDAQSALLSAWLKGKSIDKIVVHPQVTDDPMSSPEIRICFTDGTYLETENWSHEEGSQFRIGK